ncbi:HEPN domain-containing protein [Candidatus Woesearchaeota archaeon]|nr:HEPN domain-containing protein [Candidatus Woesearchaeota archaeon]HIH38359.1 HEPN domain-containing protein [Candidatus Woesearchaeota archaeon]HIH48595.1 HEPN domain-containing protein [Candidatus Woesearchaeota archaeon]HIJ03103.1 HEPN domain-containing protein [Candidatus Woesearchaeota archaeon]
MDFEYKIYLTRAENELNLSMIIQRISDEKTMQIEIFKMKEDTYYSAVISHAYYSIFFAAKAYLMKKGIKTAPPEEHRKTFDEFSQLVHKGIVDVELLKIYQNMMIKADTLLHIFELEKGKRGKFTYKRMPQANQEPAQESIENAQTFFRNIFGLCEESNKGG